MALNDSSNILNFKIVVIGDAGVGKSTFINRHRTGEFTKSYIPTMGVEVTPIPFYTNKGHVICNMWDCAGQERFSGIKEGYYVGAQAAIIVFDLTSKITYKDLIYHHQNLRHSCPTIPIVICGNKIDCKETFPAEDILFPRKRNLQYYDISAKSNYNFEKPFLYLLRKLMGDEQLVFREFPEPMVPPVVNVDIEKFNVFEETKQGSFNDFVDNVLNILEDINDTDFNNMSREQKNNVVNMIQEEINIIKGII